MASSEDIEHMRAALNMARRGLGRTWPNPSVGCVIVKDSLVIARARTADGGRPHAETQALEIAGDAAKAATAYVTLEPCNHECSTPACAQFLIDAGVRRVVVACNDPDPRTAGQGVERLRAAGIEVLSGVLEEEARALNQGFILYATENRPFMTLKVATTLDGKIALADGQSHWITGEAARAHVHLMRARHDAVLTGVGTVLSDDPLLTARVPGLDHKTVRVVLDSDLKIPLTSQLLKTACDYPLWLFGQGKGAADLRDRHVQVFDQSPRDLQTVLQTLAAQGLTRVLVEGGPALITSFLEAGLWDEFHWYRAPCVMGAEGQSVSGGLGVSDISSLYRLKRKDIRRFDQDLLEIYENPA